MGREQHQPGIRMVEAELADLGEIGQSIDVEDRYLWAMGAQDHSEALVGDVTSNDLQARLAVDHPVQTASEQVLKAGDGDRDQLGRKDFGVVHTTGIGTSSPQGEPGPTRVQSASSLTRGA